MNKTIQIDYELFLNIVKLIYSADWQDTELIADITQGLDEKIEKIISRDLYTKYRTASTPEERERAKKKYLETIEKRR